MTSSSSFPLVLQQGTPATFTVFLREQPPANQPSELAADGLFGGGVQATFDNSGSGPLRLNQASASTAITPNTGFAGTVARDVQSTYARFEANVGNQAPYLTPGGQLRIELGSFTFQTPNLGSAQIQFADPPTPGTFVFGDRTPGDPNDSPSSTPGSRGARSSSASLRSRNRPACSPSSRWSRPYPWRGGKQCIARGGRAGPG